MKKLFILLTILTVFNSTKIIAQIANQSEEEIAKKWKLGIAMWTFHNFTFEEAIAKTDSAGLEYVEIFPFQKSIKELNDTIISKLSPTGIEKLKQYLKDKNIKVGSIYAFGGKNVESWKKEFEMAKQFNLTFITAEPPRELYKSVDSLAGIYGIKVAIHNHWKEISPASWHPDTLLVALRKYPNLGVCADVGHMPKSGVDPVESIKKLEGRILALHLKDIGEKNNIKAIDVVVGTGLVNFPEIFKELKRQKFKGYIYIERDADEKPSNLPSVVQEVKYYHEQLGLKPNVRAKQAQESPQDYFIGKWDMLVKGLPQGDTHMPVVFEMKKDSISGKDEMIGHIEKTAETEVIAFSKIEQGADKITFYFTAQGYDIDVFLAKKDDENAEGKFFNMFETVAIRMKK